MGYSSQNKDPDKFEEILSRLEIIEDRIFMFTPTHSIGTYTWVDVFMAFILFGFIGFLLGYLLR